MRYRVVPDWPVADLPPKYADTIEDARRGLEAMRRLHEGSRPDFSIEVAVWQPLGDGRERSEDEPIDVIEPQIHSHNIDVLAYDHPWAWEQVYCESCSELVHAVNNECMQTWIEYGAKERRAICATCFGITGDTEFGLGVLEDRFVLGVGEVDA
jgi:hypothetical protein